MISIKGSDVHPKSSLLMTTVYSDMDTTVAKWVQAQLDGNALVMPKRELIPPNMSTQDYSKMIGDMMEESKTVAKIVALQRAGYDVKATGEGASVQSLQPGSKAEGILQVDDVIVSADGQKIETATDLVNLVRRKKPATPVTLAVQRAGQTFDAQVGTKESDTEPGIAVIGILVKTYMFGHNLPVQIDIDSENIGGSSAGLMFTLGIIDSLEKDGLAPGHKIAGTGTISLDGSVGPIGGVAQKVMGAEEAGAEYFLAPGHNYDEAKRAAKRLQVIRVDNVDEAITFLKGLRPATGNLSPLKVAPTPLSSLAPAA